MPVFDDRSRGVRIQYEVHAGPKPDAPALVLLHGVIGSMALWERVIPLLIRWFRIVNIQARGHEGSKGAGRCTLWHLAEDVLGILKQEGIREAFLVGLSMGGMTALRLALLEPQMVRGMVLLGCNAGAERWLRLNVKYRPMEFIFRHFGVGPLEGQLAPIMFGPTALKEQPELMGEFLAVARGHDQKDLADTVHAVITRESITERLSEICCPVLVLHGEEDQTTDKSCAQGIALGIRGAKLEPLPKTGHLMAMERPELVGEKIIAFVGAHVKTAPV